jgi:hypothetical protein
MGTLAEILSNAQRSSESLFGQNVGAAPTLASQMTKIPRRLFNSLALALQGQAVGTTDPNNAVSDMERANFWRGSVMGVPEDVKQRNFQRSLDVALLAPTVYHGSPHKFDKFDTSKVGTGEGAQAYGHGLYFAESPNVAGSYAKKLSDWSDGSGNVKGNLYTVDLPDAAAAKMLDWDKPLSQQPESVKKALENLPPDVKSHIGIGRYNDLLGGVDIYKPLGGLFGDDAAARMLKEAGIPGIRYLDQGSRGAGSGTSNYVVFDDNLLKILKRE